MMIHFFRTYSKAIVCLLTAAILGECVFPTAAYALTAGPSQPEIESFEPIGTSEMVDPFTGDFNYNIPLIDVGGYPINLSYHSGISMDQEASWVGLGWNINPGAIVRNMRGIPDDFNGDQVSREFNVKPNVTVGVNATLNVIGEIFGYDVSKKLSLPGGFQAGYSVGLGLAFNNYNGVSIDLSYAPSITANAANKNQYTGSLGLSSNTSSGIGINPNVSFSKRTDGYRRSETVSSKLGLAFNSRGGLQALTLDNQRERTSTRTVMKTTGQLGNMKVGFSNKTTHDMSGSLSAASFVSPTYTPKVDMAMMNQNFTLSFTLGSEIIGDHMNMRLSGYYSGQILRDHNRDLEAYGYMNLQNGQTNPVSAMLDYNREKDGGFTENTPALPLTALSYDLFTVSGQGVGGMFRPHRSDVGYVFDPSTTNISMAVNLPTIEFGVAAGDHTGLNFSGNYAEATSGLWSDDNDAKGRLKYTKADGNYEPAYFQMIGEQVADEEEALYNSYGGADPVYIDFSRVGQHLLAHMNDNPSFPVPENNHRQERARRTNLIYALNTEEATAVNGSNIEVYDPTAGTGYTIGSDVLYRNRYLPKTFVERKDGRPAHHMSQITTYRGDGARYVYGIPAYNYTQQDVIFATNGQGSSCITGLVDYSHGNDNSKDNTLGLNHYYERTTIPAYAHSYLLTSVLSPDYIDIKGDGPSEDDYGTYTKINYYRGLVDNTKDGRKPENYLYQWRVPFEQGKANYNEGLKTLSEDEGDDKGSYLYGTKELWYVHTIETKTHVAEFYTSVREDGYGVQNEQGGIGATSNKMRKLDSIVLYARQDKILIGVNAVPVKKVYFEYDYSLCGNVSNNSGNPVDKNGSSVVFESPDNINVKKGKLTLKKVSFAYGNSRKSTLSPYLFDYSTQNPDYHIKGYDRWGNYKPMTATDCNLTSAPNPSEFPYVDQGISGNEFLANQYITAWTLNKITLPSGGVINVEYESDDYAYVQNKKAMQMFQVMGTIKSADRTALESLNSGSLNSDGYISAGGTLFSLSDGTPNSMVIFKLNTPIAASSQSAGDAAVKDRYFTNEDGTYMDYMYFRFLVNLKDGKYEYVPGYAKLSADCGVVPNLKNTEGSYTYGFVRMESVDDDNQVSIAAWNFMRLYLPKVAYNQPEFGMADLLAPGLPLIKVILSTANSIYDLARGFNNSMRDFRNGSVYVQQKSIVRLYHPDQGKKGGGIRVKRLLLSDRWKTLLKNGSNTQASDDLYAEASYGQEYDYSTTDKNGNRVSSGVASYEPLLGGEENPFRKPVFFSDDKLLAPDDDYYQEEPYGESYFPSPVVGYSKVTITGLKAPEYMANAAGRTVLEFYTSKDFPTIANKRTSLIAERTKPGLRTILKLLKAYSVDDMTASQGFVVEVNDMHGKPRSQRIYAENKPEPISGMDYKYKQASSTQLDNHFMTTEKGNNFATKMVGLDYDIVADFRESNSVTSSGGIGGNLDVFLAFIFPLAIPMVFPDFSYERVRFRSSTMTKVINHYAILEQTIAYDEGSSHSTTNLLLDAETGQTLLQQENNAYDDSVYTFTYPAHWAYDKMGLAYKNIGNWQNAGSFNLNASVNGEPVFVPGDEIYYDRYTGEEKENLVANVVVQEDDGTRHLLSKGGFTIDLAADGATKIKVVRSGRRNQATQAIGKIVSMNNPLFLNPQTNKMELTFEKVIGAGAIEFGEGSPFFCECEIKPGLRYNPYNLGKRGMWRPKRNWAYLTSREQKRKNDNVDVRKDGIYSDFSPFWQKGADGFYAPPTTPTRWQYASEVKMFNPQGYELENVDALGRYSAATYGYMNMFPTAVGVNTQYREIGYDGFEDYDYRRCAEDHFNFKGALHDGQVEITSQAAHTGKRSIKVNPLRTAPIQKKVTKADCPENCIYMICPPQD